MTPPPPPPRQENAFLSTPVLVCGTILALAILASVVFLSAAGRPVEFIAGLLTSIGALGVLMLGAIGKLVEQLRATDHQNRTLRAIAENTDTELPR